jgi:hypothetical protein
LTFDPRKQRVAYFFLGFTALFVSSFFAYDTLCISQQNGIAECTGIMAVWIRDQVINHSGLFPYYSYPFEYPFMAGLVMFFINVATASTSSFLAVFYSSVSMGFFALGCLFLFYLMKIDWKRVGVFVAFAPLMWQFGLSFEYEQMFFFLLGLYFFKDRIRTSGFLLGLSSGVKIVPLVTLPLFFKEIKGLKQKIGFAGIWIGTFAGGILLEFLLSPRNFLRMSSYLSSYGVEGSWLGILFGHVINYTSATWDIGSSTALHLPQSYQIASILLIGVSLVAIYKVQASLETKCFWAFSCVYLFFWIAAPQNLMNVALLLPLIPSIKLKAEVIAPYFLAFLFSFQVLLLHIFTHGTFADYYLNLIAQGFFAVFLLVVAYGSIKQSRREPQFLVSQI